MAEERLIDDDKDRKYKIRKNADGEDELVVDDAPEEETVEEVGFEVPELDGDEEAAVMTPEQLAAREKAKAEAEAKRLADLAERCERARALVAESKYDDALFVIAEAKELDGERGEVYDLELKALTADFTDYSKVAESGAAAEGVKKYASAEIKAGFGSYAQGVAAYRDELAETVAKLNAENEEKKSARRTVFLKKRKISAIAFAATALPLVVFIALAAYFSTIMHSQLSHDYMITFFVFLGLAAAFLIATLVTAHKLWSSASLLKRNAGNSSSKLGREYEAKNAELKLVESVLSAYGDGE